MFPSPERQMKFLRKKVEELEPLWGIEIKII